MIPFDDDVEEDPLCFTRGRRRQTKEEAIYGCFLSDSDSEENYSSEHRADGRAFGRKSAVKKKRSAHEVFGKQERRRVQFVSAETVDPAVRPSKTVFKGGKREEGSEEFNEEIQKLLNDHWRQNRDGVVVGYASSSSLSEDEPDDDDENESEERVSSHVQRAVSAPHRERSDTSSDDASSAGHAVAPKRKGYCFEEVAREQKAAVTHRREKQVQAQMKREQERVLAPNTMSRLYGKGFKLLQKMGYTGGGLGKTGEGMVTPLMAKVRQKYQGLQENDESRAATSRPKTVSDYALDSSLSAVELLQQGASSAPKRSDGKKVLGRWRNNTTRERVVYKPASEISAEAKRKYTAYLSSAATRITLEDDVLYKIDHGDDLTLHDVKSSTAAAVHQDLAYQQRRQRQEVLRHGPLYASRSVSSLRIVDMTGPTERIIEDVDDLRLTLSEAMLAASQFEKQKEDEHVMVDDAPLKELRYNLQVHISQVEARIENHARLVVVEEQKLDTASRHEKQCANLITTLTAQAAVLRRCIDEVKLFRRANAFRRIERHFNLCRKSRSAKGSPGALSGLTLDDTRYREAALLKYAGANSSSSATAALMQISGDGDDEKARKSEATLDDLPVDPQQNAVDIETLFNQLIVTFKGLRESYPAEYAKFNLSNLATELGRTVLNYFDAQPQFESDFTTLLYMASLLVQFRDDCIPAGQTDLRVLWELCINAYVLRGLTALLAGMRVDPTNQDLAPLQTVFNWIDTLPLGSIVSLLETQFFPKWLEVLRLWLATPAVNLEEVYIWYNGWKSVFPEVLATQSVVQAFFMRGLQLINAHLEYLAQQERQLALQTPLFHPDVLMMPVAGLPSERQPSCPPLNDIPSPSTPASSEPPPSPPPPGDTEPLEQETPAAFGASAPLSAEAASTTTRLLTASRLVEVLEALGEEHDILLVPKYGRLHNGRQVFAFGRLSIYIDSGVIYCFCPSSGSWTCVSLATLLNKARQQPPTTTKV